VRGAHPFIRGGGALRRRQWVVTAGVKVFMPLMVRGGGVKEGVKWWNQGRGVKAWMEHLYVEAVRGSWTWWGLTAARPASRRR
jgi:hypothetical protein